MHSTEKLTAEIDHLSKQAQVQQKALNAEFGKMLKLEQADMRAHEAGQAAHAQSLHRLAAKVSGVSGGQSFEWRAEFRACVRQSVCKCIFGGQLKSRFQTPEPCEQRAQILKERGRVRRRWRMCC